MDDFRIHIDAGADAPALVDRLEGADGLEQPRVSVSHDGGDIFVYASTSADARRAADAIGAIVRAMAAKATVSGVERWLDDEDRWDDEPPGETWEQEELEHGYAPWEVRVDCGSRHAAGELADRLEAEGYRPIRHWSYLIVGTATRADADALAARLHGVVEPGGELVWETRPGNPFAIFGGMGQA